MLAGHQRDRKFRGFEGRGRLVHDFVALLRGDELEADGQAVVGQAGRDGHGRHAGEVGRNGGDVVHVHGQRVVHLLAELEGGGRAGGGHEHVDLFEGLLEVFDNQRADLLGRAVPGVVVAGGQGVGAEDDTALDLVAEAGFTGVGHHVGGGLRHAGRRHHAQAVAHAIVTGQVGADLGRHDDVVSA